MPDLLARGRNANDKAHPSDRDAAPALSHAHSPSSPATHPSGGFAKVEATVLGGRRPDVYPGLRPELWAPAAVYGSAG